MPATAALLLLSVALLPQDPRDALADARAGRFDDAERKLLALVHAQPASAAAWVALGRVYAARSRFDAALAPFEKACALDAAGTEACYYLGRCLYVLNRFAPALDALAKARAASPPENAWRVERAWAQDLAALGRADEAERHFLEALRQSRGRPCGIEDPRIDYGVFLFREGRVEESLAPLEEASATAGAPARAFAELGRTLLHLGRLDAAIKTLEKAVALEPNNWPAHLLLSRAYFRAGRNSDGEREAKLGERGLASENYGADMLR